LGFSRFTAQTLSFSHVQSYDRMRPTCFGSCRSTTLTTSCAKLERCASTTPSSNCDVLAHLRGRLRRSYEMPVGRRSRAVTKGHESSIRPSRTPQPPRGGSQQCGRIAGVYCAPSPAERHALDADGPSRNGGEGLLLRPRVTSPIPRLGAAAAPAEIMV